jgi:hypothetical protein
MHDPDIWTPVGRKHLYERLIVLFGAVTEWESPSAPAPGRGINNSFDEFCESFARIVGAKSGDAVKVQIRFAIHVHTGGYWMNGQSQAAILNKAAALEAGFITSKHIAKLVRTRKKQ